MSREEGEPLECPACGGENGPMGQLGNLVHYSCRWCGMMYSDRIPDPPRKRKRSKKEVAHG